VVSAAARRPRFAVLPAGAEGKKGCWVSESALQLLGPGATAAERAVRTSHWSSGNAIQRAKPYLTGAYAMLQRLLALFASVLLDASWQNRHEAAFIAKMRFHEAVRVLES